jgi:3'-phosphoadenosine 5'-phosphosulfate (PAPS) 3'-phosphatase
MAQMQATVLDDRLRAAEAVVREAGRLAADHFARRELLSIDRKGAQDLVSEADRECEDLIVSGLSRLFPEDGGHSVNKTSTRPKWLCFPAAGSRSTFNAARLSERAAGLRRNQHSALR